MAMVGTKVKVTNGIYKGLMGTITTSLSIPLSQIWPLVGRQNMPEPACSIVLYAVQLENGAGVSLPLDCIEFINT